MKRATDQRQRRAAWIGAAATAGAALAVVAARRARRASGATARLLGRHDGGSDAGGSSTRQTGTCECGAEYRIAGADRHRVYWPAGADESDPVVGDRCVSCGAPLAAVEV